MPKRLLKRQNVSFYNNKNGWRRFSSVKRSEMLLKIAHELEKRREEFAKTETATTESL